MNWITRIADKAGAAGSVFSGTGCAMCFPALAGLGSTLGLGFLAVWESLFIATLLPIFALLALAANALAWYSHRRLLRGLFGVCGPVLVLVGLAPFSLGLGLPVAYARWAFYIGLIVMVAVAIGDFVRPAQCAIPRRANGVGIATGGGNPHGQAGD